MLSKKNSKVKDAVRPVVNLSEGESPGAQSSSADEDSKHSLKRKKLKKKRDRDTLKREISPEIMAKDGKNLTRSDSRDSGPTNGRKASSPEKTLIGMKQKFLQQNQQKENGAVEEKRASVGRRQSVVTNYDLADALRKTSKLLKMFSAKF